MAKKNDIKKKVKKGDKFQCGDCGMVVSVDKTCSCMDSCDLICCGKPMKAKSC